MVASEQVRAFDQGLGILELKGLMKELSDIHKQDVKTQAGLMKSIDMLTYRVVDLAEDNKKLLQLIDEL